MKNSIYLFLILVLSSCSTHFGSFSGGIAGPEAKFLDMAVGSKKTTNVFMIGGNQIDGIVLEAKKDLMRAYPLKEGQAYANFITDIKTTWFLFVRTTKATVSADIICNSCDSISGRYSHQYFEKLQRNKKVNGSLIKQGGKVLLKSGSSAIVAEVIDHDSLSTKVVYNSNNGNTRIRSIRNKFVFIADPTITYKGYKVNQKVYFVTIDDNNAKHLEGVILGMGDEKILVRNSHNNKVYRLEYNLLRGRKDN